MADTRPIVVASDLSDASEIAVIRAMQLAGRRQCPLTAVHVIQEEPLWWVVQSEDLDPVGIRAELRREATAALRAQLRDAARRLDEPGVEGEVEVQLGKPAPVLTEIGRAADACLLVVGARGRHAVRDWFIGTTAEKVVRAGDVPVLVARTEPTHAWHTIVVAVDFSESSRAALKAALAWAPGAQFTLVHAYETWFESYIDATTYERLRDEQEQAIYERLRSFAREAGVRAEHEPAYRVVAGHPGTAVVDTATRAHADLVVCGTQGETGLRHLLLGSVAQHILRESRCDVLTVRGPASVG